MREPRAIHLILGVALLLTSSGMHTIAFADPAGPMAGDKVVFSRNFSNTFKENASPRRYAQAPQGQSPDQYPQDTYPQQYPDQSPQQYPPQYPDQPPQQYPPQYPDQPPQQYPQQPLEDWTPPDQWTPSPPPQQASACTVKLSKDRSTIHLMDTATGMERKHVSLGQDRVQKVFNSSDGAWSVALFKIRGVSQYGFIAIDLAKCEDQLPVDVPSMVSSALFDQEGVALTFEKGKQRFRLRNQVIQ